MNKNMRSMPFIQRIRRLFFFYHLSTKLIKSRYSEIDILELADEAIIEDGLMSFTTSDETKASLTRFVVNYCREGMFRDSYRTQPLFEIYVTYWSKFEELLWHVTEALVKRYGRKKIPDYADGPNWTAYIDIICLYTPIQLKNDFIEKVNQVRQVRNEYVHGFEPFKALNQINKTTSLSDKVLFPTDFDAEFFDYATSLLDELVNTIWQSISLRYKIHDFVDYPSSKELRFELEYQKNNDHYYDIREELIVGYMKLLGKKPAWE